MRRLHRVWPDRDGNISYLLTMCVAGRAHVLNNEVTFERLVVFLLDRPTRYQWFGRRFVVMPDHIHLIAHRGHEAIRLGQWIKALKAVVGGLARRKTPDAASGDAAHTDPPAGVGRLPPTGAAVGRVPPHGATPHEFTRIQRDWRWQEGFHDHKFRTPESESRKWEYVCLNPVRAGLVKRPEEWPFGGEIFYDEAGERRFIRGTPPLLETGMLIEEDGGRTAPGQATRPTEKAIPRPGRGGEGGAPREGTRPTRNPHHRVETEPFHSYTCDELLKRDKVNREILWLRALAESANLPAPKSSPWRSRTDLEQFATMAEDLKR